MKYTYWAQLRQFTRWSPATSKDTRDGCVWWLRLTSFLPIPKGSWIGGLILKQEGTKYPSAHFLFCTIFVISPSWVFYLKDFLYGDRFGVFYWLCSVCWVICLSTIVSPLNEIKKRFFDNMFMFSFFNNMFSSI